MLMGVVITVIAAAIGCASSLMPGPCNLAIVDGAVRGVPRHRLRATAAGGAFGDLVYATLGAAGVGALLARSPSVLHVVGGLVFVAFGTHRLVVASSHRPGDARGGGVLVGASLVLANPGVLVTWSVVVGTLAGEDSLVLRAAVVVAIAAGSFGGFLAICKLPISRLPAVRVGLGAALVALGVTSLARAAGVG